MARTVRTARLLGVAATGAVLSVGGVLAAAPSALAAYPPAEPQCSAASSAGSVGAPVTVVGVGFTPGSTVTVGGSGTAVITVPTGLVGADGSVRVVEKLGAVGSAQFTLSGTATSAACGAVAVRAIVPTPSPTRVVPTSVAPSRVTRTTSVPAQPGRHLSFTGVEGIGIASVLGLGLLGGGTALVVAGRRKGRSQA